MPKIADLVYEYTATIGTGPFTLAGARSTDFRTFAAAHSVGDTVYYSIRGGGQWEVGIGTLTSPTTLARTTVTNGSSGAGVAVNFASGNKDIYETPHSGAYVGIDELPATSTFDDGDKLVVLKANGTVSSILASIVKAASTGTGGGTPTPGDTTAPTAQSAAVANATPTYVDITMSEAMDMNYTPAASSVIVSGHTVSAVAWLSNTVLRVTVTTAFINGEPARTVSYTQPGTNNARDLAGNLLANFSSLAITNNIAAAATMAGKYAMRNTDGLGGPTAVKYPAPGNISTNGYYGGDVTLYVRDNTGKAALASEVVMWAWSKRSGGVPVQPDLTTYTQNGQKRAPSRLGGWTDSDTSNSNAYYGLYDHIAAGSLYIWGTAGTYDLWLFYSDGSAEPYDNGTGTPVGLVLS